jgi:hypothetical protein
MTTDKELHRKELGIKEFEEPRRRTRTPITAATESTGNSTATSSSSTALTHRAR